MNDSTDNMGRTDLANALREARETIDQQARELVDLRNRHEAAERERVRLAEHIKRIRDGIINEADEREWCEEVNDFLTSVGLDPWEVRYRVTFTVDVTRYGGADNEDNAIAEGREMVANGIGEVALADR